MKKIRSAGAVVFREEKNKILYLLICYGRKEKFWWDFPRGQIEKDETEKETAKREIFEETGIKDLKFIEGFKESYKYFFKEKGNLIFKENIIFLAKTKKKKVKLSFEHFDFLWLPYEKALEKLTFENSKEILKKAHQYLKHLKR
ncbi:MAG: bis(5'-nucleosyl)-tetraphosphatase [Patescibacteria group bacterium]